MNLLVIHPRVTQLVTLGRLELTADGRPVLGGRRKVLGLLAYLARHPARPIRRERLADLLWSGSPAAAARQSLRQALTELREFLGSGLPSDNEQVTLEHGTVVLDLERLEEDVLAGHWTAAADRYGGEFLAGCDDLGGESWREWLDAERGALARTSATIFQHLVQGAEQRGEWHQALRAAERWRRTLPADEDAVSAVARLLPVAGRAAATQQVRLLATPAFVGRRGQLAVLSAAWRQVLDGAGRVSLIEAEPAMGASRLLEEFGRIVATAERRPRVIAVRGYASERDTPHSLTRAILLKLLDAPGLAGVPGDLLAAWRPIVPEIGERFRHLGIPAAGLPPALHRCLTDVAAETPVLVTVDDADSADAASLEEVRHLVRHPPPRCLVVLATRPGGPMAAAHAPDFRQAAGHLDRIVLDGLEVGQLDELIQSVAAFAPETSARLAARIHQEVGGAPGVAMEILRLLIEAGVLVMNAAGVWQAGPGEIALPVPPVATERTAARLELLSGPGRALLESAAVLAEPATPESLQAVSDHPDSAPEAMAEVLSGRWIREHPSHAGRFAFVDEATRRAVYGAITPARRQEMHRRAARVIEASAESPRIRAERVRRHRQRARAAWSRRRLLGLGAAVAVASAGLVYLVGRTGSGAAGNVRVLVADVENRTGDSLFSRAVATAVNVALGDSRWVRLFPRERTRETLARMGRPGADTTLDLALAREIAEREDLDAVLALTIDRLPGSWVVTGRLIDPATGGSRGESRQIAGTPDAVLEELDVVLTELRRRMGESRDATSARRRLPLATTPSIEALRAYSDGRHAWPRDASAAIQHWRRAVELDSGFAMALLALSDWHYWNGSRDSGETYLHRALGHADRLTERERLTLLASEASRLGQPEAAVARLRTLAEAYPDRDTWYQLATTLMRQERCGESLPATRQALGFDSLFAFAWVTLATCHQLLDQPDSALAAYAQAETAQPGVLYRGSLNQEWGRVFVRVGRLAAADSAFSLMAAKEDPADRGFGLRSLGYSAMLRGQYHQAASRFLEAAALANARDAKVSELRNRVLLAEALLTMGQRTEAATALTRAIILTTEWNMEPAYHLFLGHALTRAGRLAEAAAQLEELRRKATTNRQDQSALRLLEGWVRHAGGASADALAAVAEDRFEPYAGFRHALRADAFGQLGRVDSALVAAQALVDGFHFGYDSEDEWLRGLVRLGRLAERAGDTLRARRALAAYVERWEGGDQDLPELEWARTRLRRLGGR